MGLPPELDRLGMVLSHATSRAAARRRAIQERRRRLAAGLFVFAAMTPSRLGSADQPNFFEFAIGGSAAAATFCDQPRGGRAFHNTDACVVLHKQPQAALLAAFGASSFFVLPSGPSVRHFESGREGTISQTITPTMVSNRPVASPGFSP